MKISKNDRHVHRAPDSKLRQSKIVSPKNSTQSSLQAAQASSAKSSSCFSTILDILTWPFRMIGKLFSALFCSKPDPLMDKVFKSYDMDYTGYSKSDKEDLEFAENCCSFPKLALELTKKTGKNAHFVCGALNSHIDPNLKQVTFAQGLKAVNDRIASGV